MIFKNRGKGLGKGGEKGEDLQEIQVDKIKKAFSTESKK